MKVLITGASSGIGRQLCLDYARQGYDVFAVARRKEVLQDLQSYGDGRITPVVADVSCKETVKAVFSQLPNFDIVILNAGTCEYVDIESFDSAMFERIFQVNFLGVVYCVEALLSKINRGGQLAIVSSQARYLPFTRSEAYGSSKAAIDYFTKSLAVDAEEELGVTVHAISPGFVKTPLTDKNNFSMPFLVSVEVASQAIINGLTKKKREIIFPRSLYLILKVLSLLPVSWQHRICVKMKDQKQQ